jgi:hypothetical protein
MEPPPIRLALNVLVEVAGCHSYCGSFRQRTSMLCNFHLTMNRRSTSFAGVCQDICWRFCKALSIAVAAYPVYHINDPKKFVFRSCCRRYSRCEIPPCPLRRVKIRSGLRCCRGNIRRSWIARTATDSVYGVANSWAAVRIVMLASAIDEVNVVRARRLAA